VERIDLLDWEHPDISVVAQADLLSLNRSSMYYQAVPPSLEEIRRKHRIDELYTAHPFMGYRTIAAVMNREGEDITKHHQTRLRTFV
jgi:putative transposase